MLGGPVISHEGVMPVCLSCHLGHSHAAIMTGLECLS